MGRDQFWIEFVPTNVPKDTIIFCVDFSKNYTLMVQNKIQNMHRHNYK